MSSGLFFSDIGKKKVDVLGKQLSNLVKKFDLHGE